MDITNRAHAASESGKAHDDSAAHFKKLKIGKDFWREEGSYVGGRFIMDMRLLEMAAAIGAEALQGIKKTQTRCPISS